MSGWDAIYFGETADLSSRTLETHPKMGCIQFLGATHIHAHTSSENEGARQAEKADLTANWDPPCNDCRPKLHQASSPAPRAGRKRRGAKPQHVEENGPRRFTNP